MSGPDYNDETVLWIVTDTRLSDCVTVIFDNELEALRYNYEEGEGRMGVYRYVLGTAFNPWKEA